MSQSRYKVPLNSPEHITLRVDSKMKKQLQREAKKLNTTLSEVIRQKVDSVMKSEKKSKRK